MTDTNNLEWMLWLVDDGFKSDPPQANLIRAIQHYTEKYGSVPNRCEVAPGWAEQLKAPAGMLLTPSKNVRPNHFLLTLDPDLKLSSLIRLPLRQSPV